MAEEMQDLSSSERTPFGEAFSRAAKKPEGKSCNDFLDAILIERPDLRGQMAYFPEQGGCGYTVFIGDEVFKGPKWNGVDNVDNFDKEMKVLQNLEGRGLPVPRVTCVGKDFVFYGMTRSPGITAGHDLNDTLTLDEQGQLAKDMVGFVIDMAKATATEDGKFMMHDDLHYNNILIDPETKRLIGVIDFGLVKNVTRDGWGPAWAFDYYVPSFAKMLKEEYASRKDELSGAAPQEAAKPKTMGMSNA